MTDVGKYLGCHLLRASCFVLRRRNWGMCSGEVGLNGFGLGLGC